MPKSDDINALYDQFGGNPNSFQEIGRTARAAEAQSRWPLFSHLAKERGGSVPPASDQTQMAAKPVQQAEAVPQLTPSGSEPALPTEWLQSLGRLFQSGARNTDPAPAAQNTGSGPATVPTPAPSIASSTPLSVAWSENKEPTPVNPKPFGQQAPAALPAAMPSPDPVFPSGLLSVATVQAPSPAAAPASVSPPATSPRVGASPLRRLVRVDPPAPPDSASNDSLLDEDLASVFSRLAGRPSRDPGW